jgi:nucleoside 2-deoxyribosyltransferase
MVNEITIEEALSIKMDHLTLGFMSRKDAGGYPDDFLKEEFQKALDKMKGDYKTKIYLAGPDVFRSNAVEHLESLKNLCSKYNFEGLAPLDNTIDIAPEHLLTPVHSNLIFKANLDMIKKCDVIIANIDCFRGACIDDGTAWEIGCGFALGKKIYGYSDTYKQSLVELTDEMFDITNQPKYTIVENFGNTANLMIVDSILDSGGGIFGTFEHCLMSLSGQTIAEYESTGCCPECGEGFGNEEEWKYDADCICGDYVKKRTN